MLGKLIKNDLKAGMFSVAGVYTAALIAGICMVVGLLLDSMAVKALSSLALLVIMLVALCITFFQVISVFQKTMYGSVGYLTLSLPVKEWQLIFSKTVSGIVFILASYLLLITCTAGVSAYLTGLEGVEYAMSFWQTLESYGFPSGTTLKAAFLLFALLGLVQILLIVTSMYLAVTFTNTTWFARFGTIGSVVLFFVLYLALSGIASSVGGLIHFYVLVSDDTVRFTFSESAVRILKSSGAVGYELSRMLIKLLAAVGMFFATVELTKKKINVK